MPDGHDVIAEVLAELASLTIRRASRDLSLTAISALSTVERAGPQRLTDLAVAEGITQPSMTSVVRQLEDRGLAERRGDSSDGRVVLVSITRSGRKYLRSLRQANASALTRLIDQLPAPDLAGLSAALPAFRRLLDLSAPGPTERRDGLRSNTH